VAVNLVWWNRLTIGLAFFASTAMAVASDARAAGPDGMPACISEMFDTVTPPALPPGWVATNALGAEPLWVVDASLPDTAPNSAFVGVPTDAADKRLESAPIPITSAGTQLSFRQAYVFPQSRDSVDGGVIEISADGGPFVDVTLTGASFLLGGYNGSIAGNALDGRQGWVMTSPAYSTVLIDLGSALAGHTIVVRWRMASSGWEAIDGGWRVDSLVITQPCTLPAALRVDEYLLPTLPSPASSQTGNGVLEPGEVVDVDPVYRATGSSGVLLSGTAISFDGPAGAYAIPDASADYGNIGPGAANDCHGATGNCYAIGVAINVQRPVLHWDGNLMESLSDGSVRSWRIHVGDSFADAPPSNLFYNFIETLLHNGVTGGCAGGGYCPDASTARKQMAVFVLKAKFGHTYEPPACHGVFTDVACPGPFTNWIEDLYARGIAAGCGAGPAYCPEAPVSRQQMAVFLMKTRQGPGYTPPACTGVFPDVPCSNPFAPWIEDLYFRNIAAGCSGGNFCPTAATTRGQMAPFLVKTFGLLPRARVPGLARSAEDVPLARRVFRSHGRTASAR
jgi:hypothetical protein